MIPISDLKFHPGSSLRPLYRPLPEFSETRADRAVLCESDRDGVVDRLWLVGGILSGVAVLEILAAVALLILR